LEFTDHELIAEIRSGSTVAFERLMGRYERLVYSIAFGFTGEREAALDVSGTSYLTRRPKMCLVRPMRPRRHHKIPGSGGAVWHTDRSGEPSLAGKIGHG
jgi:hypothetical protein